MRMFLVVLGVVLLGSIVASANGLGVFGSYWDTKDADSGYGGGVKLQMEIIPNISIEARGSYFPDFGEAKDDEPKINIIPAEADAIIKFPIAKQFAPYVGGGAGYYMFNLDNDVEGVDVSIDNELGYFALAGLEIGLGEQVVLFAEGKYTWMKATVKVKSGGVELVDEKAKFDGFGGNAGLMLKW